MLRIIISITKIIVTAIVCLFMASCNLNIKEITGSGKIVSETRNVGGQFTKVVAKNGLDVVIVQSDVVSVVVEADDNLQPHIKTEVKGNTLEIFCEYNSFINVGAKKITVKMPKIEGLSSESGVMLTTMGSLRSEDLDLESSSGSTLKGEFEADDLTADSSSGSNMELSGKAIKYDASSSSGSHIESGELIANEVRAEASSGSSMVVHPVIELIGKASSGGSVQYNNEPKSFKQDTSSGGSVSKK
ncbi:GIN domain-containing protein [Flavobacterium silvaticum]|uniref:DUF2807 domain-containing protein n=1 Tax=Flavobacterium silvaticum TaxID=1852020 RepID=A0A972FQ70_9FLAO|nr:DUF2807 domain-containing protein [Flavobacterium silvaticum]NMH29335.1 DUF2807 domain-containing protein [Flavobacterium silvaticum]